MKSEKRRESNSDEYSVISDAAAPRRLKVLISAYACEPEKGSEPGIGWNLAKAMAVHHDVWVLTRANNRPVIEAYLAQHQVPGMHFIYYDLPRWARWWKRGSRGVQAYYYLWQLGAISVARAAHVKFSFEIVHHATFKKYWAPAAVAFLPAPFIWGPVGGGESIPRPFLRDLPTKSRIYEWIRVVVRWLGEHDPLVRATAQRAEIAIATTPETSSRLRRIVNCPVVANMVGDGIIPAEFPPPMQKVGTVADCNAVRFISVGRLLGWKGYHLAIRAFARIDLPGAHYLILGDGPERRNLEALVKELRIQTQVEIVGAVPRSVVLQKLVGADVLVHPSLHDSGGWATLEAMAASLPVICLGIGGPAVQVTHEVGRVVTPIQVEQTVEDLSKAMRELATDPELRTKLGLAARLRANSEFVWGKEVDQLTQIYENVLKGAKSPQNKGKQVN